MVYPEVQKIAQSFDPITLAEMDEVKLLNRTDTKFVFSANDLPGLLIEVMPHYRLLEVADLRLNRYRTLYYDTPDFSLYRNHQNGKLNRYKVRIRKYLDSDLCFLEIKFKSNKGRTDKKRIRINDFEDVLSQSSRDYITEVMRGRTIPLEAKLWNNFTRLTLVSRTDPERLTIDLGLGFEAEQRKGNMSKVVIAEVKQEKASRDSAFVSTIKSHLIRPMGFSKYCMGTALLFRELKQNSFKQRFLAVNKLSDELVY